MALLRKVLLVAGVVIVAASPCFVHPQAGRAQEARTIRIAALAPRGSQWMRVFQAWAQSVQKETDGRVMLEVMPSAAGTSDEALLRRMRQGSVDGITVTATGLVQVAPAALVLAAPGLYDGPEALDRVRDALDGVLAERFVRGGHVRLGWFDLGQARLLSKDVELAHPEGLRKARPWSGPDDVVFAEVLRAGGAKPVRMPVAKVGAALREGRVDVVPASAIGALALGWHTEVSRMSAESLWPLVGATVIRKQVYDALPEEAREALSRTGERAHGTLRRLLRRDDQNALNTLASRGVRATSLERDAWAPLLQKARQRLAARHYADLLGRAEALAR
jgi:TRAP-type transport system periplasmic protein